MAVFELSETELLEAANLMAEEELDYLVGNLTLVLVAKRVAEKVATNDQLTSCRFHYAASALSVVEQAGLTVIGSSYSQSSLPAESHQSN